VRKPGNVSVQLAPLAELLNVLLLLDFERTERIGEFWGHSRPGPSASS
jgi:hypothetical protein